MTAKRERLELLHDLTTESMIERVQTGEATSADFQAITKFLKDNDISASMESGSAMSSLKDSVERRKARKSLSVVERDDLKSNIVNF